ncbi:hypothetical protein PROFUN_06696 [Planoprotostelium fungivorum]|uniref:Uncharacterized protein n=1 Tax=Planoprotostelium fungivorum TaxID=1890364 RepID=A0A2P6NG37_9EUKA|nr:hypothetical protein PROFUN_06696 [Planoprotostelium fungivorum]
MVDHNAPLESIGGWLKNDLPWIALLLNRVEGEDRQGLLMNRLWEYRVNYNEASSFVFLEIRVCPTVIRLRERIPEGIPECWTLDNITYGWANQVLFYQGCCHYRCKIDELSDKCERFLNIHAGDLPRPSVQVFAVEMYPIIKTLPASRHLWNSSHLESISREKTLLFSLWSREWIKFMEENPYVGL